MAERFFRAPGPWTKFFERFCRSINNIKLCLENPLYDLAPGGITRIDKIQIFGQENIA